MILFLVSIALYIGVLLGVRPSPTSLKSKSLTIVENFRLIRGSLFLGTILLIVFFMTSDLGFLEVNEELYAQLALGNLSISIWTPVQALTSNLIHINIQHVLSNVLGIGVLSVYERRVGTKRYLTVLVISSLVSCFSILFYSEPIAISGISGGVFGLIASYFIDRSLSGFREWSGSILMFIIVFGTLSFDRGGGTIYQGETNFQTDHLGHVLGVVAAIVYCRLKPHVTTS